MSEFVLSCLVAIGSNVLMFDYMFYFSAKSPTKFYYDISSQKIKHGISLFLNEKKKAIEKVSI